MRTIVEVPEFAKDADGLMGETYLEDLKDELARDPMAGDVIAGTGGIRKIRGRRVGSGKRGGVRVYYYPCKSAKRPIYLIACLAKADDRPMNTEERKSFKELAKELDSANVVQLRRQK